MIRSLQQTQKPGNIYLHSMPGRFETIGEIAEELQENNVTKIICLTDYDNIEEYSDDYLKAVKSGSLSGIEIRYTPVLDFGIPRTQSELSDYNSALEESVAHLESENLLIHCAGGVGRTGTFTIILMRALGYSYDAARTLVSKAGSGPEEDEQNDFCKNYPV